MTAILPVVGRDLPDVGECYGDHRSKSAIALYGDIWSCPQCDGRHRHVWVLCLVLDKTGALIGKVRRCSICGGRQCDAECIERRHHRGPHMTPAGELRPVGK